MSKYRVSIEVEVASATDKDAVRLMVARALSADNRIKQGSVKVSRIKEPQK